MIYKVRNTLKTEGQTVTQILNTYHQTPRGYTQQRDNKTQRQIITNLLKETTHTPGDTNTTTNNIHETPQFYAPNEIQDIKKIIENMNIRTLDP